ncbi:MAG TPA: hypothetical protein VI358_13595, partial [Pseudolabrys sp.]
MGADQGGNFSPGLFDSLRKLVNRSIAFAGFCACSRLDVGGSRGNPHRADPDSRPFEGVGERDDCSRLARAHAFKQQFRLAIKQLKNFPF